MIIFIYGENSYLSRLKLREIRDKFNREVDPSGGSFFSLDINNSSLSDLDAKYSPASLFSRKRMVVAENVFASKNKVFWSNFLNFLEKKVISSSDNVLLVYDNSVKNKIVYGGVEKVVSIDAAGREKDLDKSALPLFAFLKKQKFSQEFKKINDIKLPDWIREEFEKKGFYIDYSAINNLISNTGTNLWLLSGEIDKLVAYKTSFDKKTINIEDVKTVVGKSYEDNIFALTDAVGSGNLALSLKILEEQRLAGLSYQYILSMLFKQFKTIYQIKLLLADGMTSRAIASQLGLHLFVVQKNISQAKNFSQSDLPVLMRKILELDSASKSETFVSELGLVSLLIDCLR